MTTVRHPYQGSWFSGALALVLLTILSIIGCDTVAPEAPDLLVAEAFFTTGDSAPVLRLSRTRALQDPFPRDGSATAVSDGEATLSVNGHPYAFAPVDGSPGHYQANEPLALDGGADFAFSARWDGQEATAEGTFPTPIHLDSFQVAAADRPIRAVFFDSVFVDPTQLDSLQLDSLRTGAEEGFVYPVEVQLWWTEAPADEYWVRTQLRPAIPAGSSLDDFFLRPEETQLEAAANCPSDASCPVGVRSWIGVYGVPVVDDDSPLPAHMVQLALIRSGEDYARFAATRGDPRRREPVSNVTGGLGIVAGLALDTVSVHVER